MTADTENGAEQMHSGFQSALDVYTNGGEAWPRRMISFARKQTL